MGVKGNITKWLRSFLTDRQQQVAVNGVLSQMAPVKSGVPQASVLGPFRFHVMINDIDSSTIHSKITCFAGV